MIDIPDIHESLLQWLETNPALVSWFGDRIYHEWAPQDQRKYPLLIFQLVSGSELSEDMDSPDIEGIEQANYQFDVYATNSAEAVRAGKAFHDEMRQFRGTIGSVEVQHVTLGNKVHLGERDGDKQRRRVNYDFVIFFNSSEAT